MPWCVTKLACLCMCLRVQSTCVCVCAHLCSWPASYQPDRLYQYLARDLSIRYHRRLGPKCGPFPQAHAPAAQMPRTPSPLPLLAQALVSAEIPQETVLYSLQASLVHAVNIPERAAAVPSTHQPPAVDCQCHSSQIIAKDICAFTQDDSPADGPVPC